MSPNLWPGHALLRHRAQLVLGDVQPTSMLWGVMEFQTSNQLSASLWFEDLVDNRTYADYDDLLEAGTDVYRRLTPDVIKSVCPYPYWGREN